MPKDLKDRIAKGKKRMEKSEEFEKLGRLILKRDFLDFEIRELTSRITREYSPYRKNMKILYTHNLVVGFSERHGIIRKVSWSMPDGVDGFWELQVEPCNSNFEPFKGSRRLFILDGQHKILKIVG